MTSQTDKNDADSLPGYSSSRISNTPATNAVTGETFNADFFHEQTYKLEDTKGRPWVWLKVKSRAESDKRQPLFFDQDIIEATVIVDFTIVDGARIVTLTAQGGVTAVGQEELVFFKIEKELFNVKNQGGRKAQGCHTFTTQITLPKEAADVDNLKKKNTEKTMYPLPPSFSERASTIYIDYKLIVTIRRGTFKVNHVLSVEDHLFMLSTNFQYMPIIRAAAPSTLRQVAYQEGSPILGPEIDPDGWKVLPPITLSGTLFTTKKVTVEITLAISNPLTYASGSPIPIFITVSSSDNQAVDLISTPSSIKLHLVRERYTGSDAVKEDSIGRSNNTFREVVGTAFFWPSTSANTASDGTEGEKTGNGSLKRILQGELEVRRGLKPSFVFPRFALRYSIVLMPVEAAGFIPDTSTGPSTSNAAGQALVAQRVTVTSINAPGILPRSYAPPGYEHKEEGDYNAAVGYLENGNQRFYHIGHHFG
ncbi:hypothetical protein C8Q75DRAFT_806557 [Abortiporus biennis]|nr:hypothetical protein C8Q75DRAFT_806557 [Abortiporus biennis]